MKLKRPMICDIKYDLIKTTFGEFVVAITDKGISRVLFPRDKKPKISDKQKGDGEIAKILFDYMHGKEVNFSTLKFDFSNCTDFQMKVYKSLAKVPFGEKVSYKKLGQMVGVPKGARAIGSAMRLNPIPILIPCHRVLTSAGTLGGYSKGLNWKKRLLKLEKVNF